MSQYCRIKKNGVHLLDINLRKGGTEIADYIRIPPTLDLVNYEIFNPDWLQWGLDKIENDIEKYKLDLEKERNKLLLLRSCDKADVADQIEESTSQISSYENVLEELYETRGEMQMIHTIITWDTWDNETQSWIKDDIRYLSPI